MYNKKLFIVIVLSGYVRNAPYILIRYCNAVYCNLIISWRDKMYLVSFTAAINW